MGDPIYSLVSSGLFSNFDAGEHIGMCRPNPVNYVITAMTVSPVLMGMGFI